MPVTHGQSRRSSSQITSGCYSRESSRRMILASIFDQPHIHPQSEANGFGLEVKYLLQVQVYAPTVRLPRWSGGCPTWRQVYPVSLAIRWTTASLRVSRQPWLGLLFYSASFVGALQWEIPKQVNIHLPMAPRNSGAKVVFVGSGARDSVPAACGYD